jgi:N-acetylmuramoyl-L-alanine amidase
MIRSAAAILVLAACGIALLYDAGALSAADTNFPIYFEDSTLPLQARSINRVTYLPLLEIVSHLTLPYTDDFRLETFTLGPTSARLVTTRNSALISVNGQVVLLQNAVRRDDGQWLVPLDFLSQGLSRVTGIEFRYRPGSSRVFAGVTPVELVMNAQAIGPTTRLTLRTGVPVDMEVQRDGRRTTVVLKGKRIDPLREQLDYKDRLVESVVFDDGDGISKIVVGATADLRDIRTSSADENRVHFIDFLREAALTATPPPLPPAGSAIAKSDPRPGAGLRVIVIDPGHGGMDNGTEAPVAGSADPNASGTGVAPATATDPASAAVQTPAEGTQPPALVEKELTLNLSRALRGALQGRLGATVLLTRDADVALTNEARSAVANNNQAGLLISLHVGYSADPTDSGSSIYLIQPDFAEGVSPTPVQDRLFLPWYMAYRKSRDASEQMAKILQQDLTAELPGWKFALRTGPIGVLASATMPSIAIEVGNINNPSQAAMLSDPAFHSKLAAGIAIAVEKFAASRVTGRP